ncbi:MAG: HDOD domain-containing protein [Vicinamibacterales bacterium]
MSPDAHTRNVVVSVALARSSNLAMLPETAMRVLRLANDPNVTMARLAEVITTSPELCARILRIMNSAFYGFPGEVRSIERATTLMGLESVRNVTIAASLTRLFQGRALSPRFSPRDLWTHSVAVATATRLLALAARPNVAEEAFLAGMLHDIGLMMELQMDRLKLGTLIALVEAGPSADLLTIEEELFGATHQDFGAALLTAWHLPSTMSHSAQYHHDPSHLPAEHAFLPALVHVADRIVTASHVPFLLEDPSTDVSDELLETLRLTRAQMDDVAAMLPDATRDISALLHGPG